MKRLPIAVYMFLGLAIAQAKAQDADLNQNNAGHVPVISGGVGYVHVVDGGVVTLEPQINPILLLPLGKSVLLESRTDFTGFFQRRDLTSGDFTGRVFKTVEFAQIDWLANTHVMVTAGKYLLPFGLYNERLDPIWIRNLQNSPINAAIGTRTSGAGDGLMLRGVIHETPAYRIQYTTYFSARSGIEQLSAARTAGEDSSIFLTHPRLEVGLSYQRFLQDRNTNNVATYLSWQPPRTALDVKAEYDYSYSGRGYWIEGAYALSQSSITPAFLKRIQLVARGQHFQPLNGGGNSVPRLATQVAEFGLNYYFRDDLRLISSYGRQFVAGDNANLWTAGFTYRFLWPLWPGRK